MGLDLQKQFRQIQELNSEIERALTIPAQIQGLISDVDAMIGQMQRIRFNLQTTLTDFKANGENVDRKLYGEQTLK